MKRRINDGWWSGEVDIVRVLDGGDRFVFRYPGRDEDVIAPASLLEPGQTAHRITDAKPGTWTLVLRGPTRRKWGFYLPAGWIVWTSYPYQLRRPSQSSKGIG